MSTVNGLPTGGGKVSGYLTLSVNINSGSDPASQWRTLNIYLVDGVVDHITYNGSNYTYNDDMWGQNNGKMKIRTAEWVEE